MDQQTPVKSLAKALNVLECFTVEKPELGISEISRMLGLQKSTVHNILSTFAKCGYVTQNAQNNKYRLGLKFLHMSYIVSSNQGLRDIFLPALNSISRETREVCYFGILDDFEVLYIEAAYPSTFQQTRNILGERAPLYCTGLGKAMMAFLPEEALQKALSAPRTRYTVNTMTEEAALRRQLAEIRQNGYSVDNMEHEFGICCVGVPVFGASGEVIAAVSVSGPSPRFDHTTILRHAETIIETLKPMQYQIGNSTDVKRKPAT